MIGLRVDSPYTLVKWLSKTNMTYPEEELDSCLSMCEDIISLGDKASKEDIELLSLLQLRLTGTSLGVTLGFLLKEDELAEKLNQVLKMLQKLNSLNK